ncbi:MAG: AAA family ATPase, partial [Bdellovibrionota bacterium]
MDPATLSKSKSLILLGPRQTGKSTLLKEVLPDALYFNLLDDVLFRQWVAHPEYLRQQVPASSSKSTQRPQWVVIDEIQRIPNLLNEVQLILDSRKDIRFVLTGSSARKLKRGHANLLGGRAHFSQLHPLVYPEIGTLRLLDRLQRGGLPAIFDSEDYKEDLKAYVGGYLKEEIQAESLVRNLGNFARFLETAALCNGLQINLTQIGSDLGISPRTIKDYFTLLEDTLIGNLLDPFSKTKKRKAVAIPKFYLFDLGAANALQGRFSITPQTPFFGGAVEHLVYLELKAWLQYRRRDEVLGYWRSQTQFEVDF